MRARNPVRRLALLLALGAALPACTAGPAATTTAPAKPAPRAEHVVLVVWDGMRPDFVNDELTPALAGLARDGVTFARHHSVYPTSTEVNGTALATGCYPGRSGILANREFRPALDPVKPVAMEALDSIRKGDAATGGRHVAAPTLPELLHAAGKRTAVAGTKGVALLWDRAEREDPALPAATRESPVVFAGNALPAARGAEVARALGAAFPPDVKFPNAVADTWSTRALTEGLWKDGVPAFSVLWLSDPDFSQHQTGPGTPVALAALKSVDGCLRRVLDALGEKGVREKTDVFVVSDHGFSSISRSLDPFEVLAAAGFPVKRVFAENEPRRPGDILVVGLGGSTLYYVADHDAGSTRRLVEFFQRSDFAAVIFTRDPLPGTFPLAEAKLENLNAPDVVVTMRWSDGKSEFASAPGLLIAEGRKPGQGTHASLSPFDLHNTCIAAGPDLKPGFRDETPSGNVDLAPTVAHLLGLPLTEKMDGRVLTEALRDAGPDPTPSSRTATAEQPEIGWRQELRIVTVSGTDYFDQGSGGATAAKP